MHLSCLSNILNFSLWSAKDTWTTGKKLKQSYDKVEFPSCFYSACKRTYFVRAVATHSFFPFGMQSFCSLGFVLFPNSYHVLDKTHCWCRSVCFHCWLDVVLSWYASRSTSLFIQKKYENDKIAFFSDGNYSWCNCKRCLCFVFFIIIHFSWVKLTRIILTLILWSSIDSSDTWLGPCFKVKHWSESLQHGSGENLIVISGEVSIAFYRKNDQIPCLKENCIFGGV